MKEIITLEPPDTIMMKLSGELTENQAKEIHERMAKITGGLENVKLLIDLKEVKNIPPQAREAFRRLPRTISYEKLAVFGASARLRVLGGLILKMIPQVKKSRFFHTEEKARAWLAEEK
jgi:hypothetical protein